MDLSYTPAEEAFRASVRGWLAPNLPETGSPRDLAAMRAWQRKLHAAGFLGAAWPKEYGGAGLSPMEQAILNEELTRVRAHQVGRPLRAPDGHAEPRHRHPPDPPDRRRLGVQRGVHERRPGAGGEPPRRRGAGVGDRLERARERAERHRGQYPLRSGARLAEDDGARAAEARGPSRPPARRRPRHQGRDPALGGYARADRLAPRAHEPASLGRHEAHVDEPRPGVLRGGDGAARPVGDADG